MLDWLRRRFSRREWDLGAVRLPWDPDRPSLAGAIEARLQPDGDRLDDSGFRMPDEGWQAPGEGLHLGAGARDGIALFHLPAPEEPAVVARVTELLREVLADGGLPRLPALYQAIVAQPALLWIDELADAVSRRPTPDPNRLYALALLLAGQAPDREAVKAGIAMMGLVDLSLDDLALLRLLGSHDELTLFAAGAVAAHSPLPEQELWAMARRVKGWGRIHAVRRIVDVQDPAVARWLLVEGFHNTVMDRYTALHCAEAGGLARALEAPEGEEVDEELLAAAGALLAVLLEEGGPVAGMEHYADGARAVRAWLRLLAEAETLPLAAPSQVGAVIAAARRRPPPWTAAEAQALKKQARALLSRGDWLQRVQVPMGGGAGPIES